MTNNRTVYVTQPDLPPLDDFIPSLRDADIHGLPSAQRANLPVAADAAARVLCLPIDPALQDEQQSRVIGLIRNL